MDHAHHHAHDGSACDHAAQRSQEAGEALQRAETACQARGLRLTPIRANVLAALYATHRPLGAYELIDALAAGGAKRLAPITVYRALDFLIEQGLAHRLASRNAFVACPHGHGPVDPIVFLICEACGGVDEISSSEVSDALARLLAAQHFKSGHPVLEIAGRCSHCQG